MKKVVEINFVVGEAIRDGLLRMKMTQKELAILVNSTQRSISSYVNGNAQPPLDVLRSICKTLQLNLNQILQLSNYNYPQCILVDPKEIAILKIINDIPEEKRNEFIEIILRIKEILLKK